MGILLSRNEEWNPANGAACNTLHTRQSSRDPVLHFPNAFCLNMEASENRAIQEFIFLW